MKKTLLFVLVSAAALLLIMSGCSKKDSGGPSSNMATYAGSYKLTAATVTAGGVTQDAMNYLFEPCQQDDILQLKADSSMILTDAGTTCTPDGSGTGKWYVSGSYLITIESQQNDTATIKSFNGTALVLTHPDELGGVPITVTVTMTKQ